MITDDIKNADFVAIAIGNEILKNDFNEVEAVLSEFIAKLEGVNYFIVSSTMDGILRKMKLNQKRIACPLCKDDIELEEKQWDFYNKWLSATLSKNLLILELGEGFEQPNVVRWPFERIVMINQKSKMYRVHSTFSQIPAEINDRAVSISKNAFDFMKG